MVASPSSAQVQREQREAWAHSQDVTVDVVRTDSTSPVPADLPTVRRAWGHVDHVVPVLLSGDDDERSLQGA